MRVSPIELANWKNIRTVAVDLPERVFLVGPNASGKSNFVDAFRSQRDLIILGGFKKAHDDLRGGISRIRCLVARKYPEIRIAIELTEGSREHWRYEIAFTQDNNRSPRLTKEIVHRGGKGNGRMKRIVVISCVSRKRHWNRSAKTSYFARLPSFLRVSPICTWCHKSFVTLGIRSKMAALSTPTAAIC